MRALTIEEPIADSNEQVNGAIFVFNAGGASVEEKLNAFGFSAFCSSAAISGIFAETNCLPV